MMTRPRKSAPDVVARAQRILADLDERRRQVAAGEEPYRRGHRSSTDGNTPETGEDPQHPDE